jgi:hypothetical protein
MFHSFTLGSGPKRGVASGRVNAATTDCSIGTIGRKVCTGCGKPFGEGGGQLPSGSRTTIAGQFRCFSVALPLFFVDPGGFVGVHFFVRAPRTCDPSALAPPDVLH